MKAKLLQTAVNCREKFKKATPALSGVVATSIPLATRIAHAATNADAFVESIIAVVGAGGIIYGIILGVMGFISYSEAKAEGEGPAMAKAQNKLSAAVLLLIVGAAIVAAKSTLAGYITGIDIF